MGMGELATHFKWLDGDVHWGLSDLDFEKPMAKWKERCSSGTPRFPGRCFFAAPVFG